MFSQQIFCLTFRAGPSGFSISKNAFNISCPRVRFWFWFFTWNFSAENSTRQCPRERQELYRVPQEQHWRRCLVSLGCGFQLLLLGRFKERQKKCWWLVVGDGDFNVISKKIQELGEREGVSFQKNISFQFWASWVFVKEGIRISIQRVHRLCHISSQLLEETCRLEIWSTLRFTG